MAEQPAVWEFVRPRMTVPGVAAAYGYFVDGATPGTHHGLPSRCRERSPVGAASGVGLAFQ